MTLINQKLNRGEVLLKMSIVTDTEAPTQQNGQSFKNKSNSLCPSRAELKIKKCHTVQPKSAAKKLNRF